MSTPLPSELSTKETATDEASSGTPSSQVADDRFVHERSLSQKVATTDDSRASRVICTDHVETTAYPGTNPTQKEAAIHHNDPPIGTIASETIKAAEAAAVAVKEQSKVVKAKKPVSYPNCKSSPVAAATASKTKAKRALQVKRDKRLLNADVSSLRTLPALSKEIKYLTPKLAACRVPFFFTDSPVGLDWADSKAIKSKYPPIIGYGDLRPPICLLLDAATATDQLVVLNWWRFMSKDHQIREYDELRNTYANPKFSNRLLPPDYWDSMRKYNMKKQKPPPGSLFLLRMEKADGIPAKKQEPTCRGWKGPKYDALFRPCFMAELSKTRISMQGSAKSMPDSIPIIEAISKSKHVNDIHFVRENDSDYVLRSKECSKILKLQQPKGNYRILCDQCNRVSSHVAELRVKPMKNPAAVDLSVLIEKQKQEIKSLKTQLKNAHRREQRRKERVEVSKMELSSRQNAAQSLTVLCNRRGGEAAELASDQDDDMYASYGDAFAHTSRAKFV